MAIAYASSLDKKPKVSSRELPPSGRVLKWYNRRRSSGDQTVILALSLSHHCHLSDKNTILASCMFPCIPIKLNMLARDDHPTRLKPRRAKNKFFVSPPTFKYFFCTPPFAHALSYSPYVPSKSCLLYLITLPCRPPPPLPRKLVTVFRLIPARC